MAKNESRGSSRRRENGDGSVFFRKSKGLWCAELTTEFDAQGRRKRRTIYGRTKAEVIAKMKEVEAAVTVGTYVPPSRLTVGAYLKDWLQVAAKPSLRITTFERYRGLIENHAIPTVGNAPLQALMPLQLQALYNQKLAEGLSPRSVQFLHTVIRKALSQAVKWGYVTQNAADAVDPPRPRKKELQVLDAEQVGIFLTAAKENTFYPLDLPKVFGSVMLQEPVTIGREGKGYVKCLCVSQGLLHTSTYRVLIILGFNDGQRYICLVVQDVVGSLPGTSGGQFPPDYDPTVREGYFLPDLPLEVPSCINQGRRDVFGADVSFRQHLLAHTPHSRSAIRSFSNDTVPTRGPNAAVHR
jgi:hypothetical protein